MKTLLDLYKSHTGKVSDKWMLYLREYDRLFATYREKAISMLEIGIQNGGSLEIWSQYFPNAQKLIGCDINPDCAALRYEDPRIAVIVGDATTTETQTKVLEQSATFDLVIEDGSHTSSDIVKAFARYFPALKTGGLFVVEDLHCSYWQEYEGGIFHPYSSITFFKHLADVVNHEHWGVEKSRADLIGGFKQLFEVDFEEEMLSQISSIEFLNSICVVRKKEAIENLLGSRHVAGLNSEIVPMILNLANTESKPLPQAGNGWTTLNKAPAESYLGLVQDLDHSKECLVELRKVERSKAAEYYELEKLAEKYLKEIDELKEKNSQKNRELNSILKSKSWRITYIFRAAWGLMRNLKNNIYLHNKLKWIFKEIPLPDGAKRALKFITYNYFGIIFSETEGYRHWIYIREMKRSLKYDGNLNFKKTNLQTKIARGNKNKILVIDTTTPTPDRDAGSLTAWYFLKSMVDLGYSVDFIPADLNDLGKYTTNLNLIGVKTYSVQDIKTIEEYLVKVNDSVDVVFLYRVHTAANIFPLIKKYLPSAKIVFNTVDLHYLREERQAALNSDLSKKIEAKRTKEIEYRLMEESDVTIVLSDIEVDLVRAENAKVNLKTIPLLMEVPGCKKDFDMRKDVVFIGGFSHAPNVDGIKYFIQEIWPLVKNHIDGGRLIIIGSNPPKELLDLCEGDDQIKILGYVENIESNFDNCRLSIAPLRYGAGIKGKIGTSSSYGVPCIATSVAAEGMGMKNGIDLIIADKPEDFAKNLILIYHNKEKWENISKNTIEFIEKNYSYSMGRNKIKTLLDELMGRDVNRKRLRAVPNDGHISLLIELSSFDKGGLEKVVLDSALAFDRKRFEVTIVTAGKIGHLGEIAKGSGLKVIGLNQKDMLGSYDKLLNDNKFDVAISHFSDLGYRLFARYEIPNITFIHNVYAFFSNEQSEIFENNDKFVNRYISVSKNATRYAVGNLGVKEAKIETIANGLIISEHEERERRPATLSRQDLGLSDSDYVFLNVASYNLHKGHYLMIDAMKHLLKMRNDVKILCVGNVVYEPHYKELVSYIQSEGLQEYIIMPGYIPDVALMHRISDAFLLPSFIEGWSIAMNEAMFYKKPMILTNTGASAEVIENEDIGILIENEYGDVVDLNSQILDELAYKPQKYRTASILAKAMNRMATDRDDWKKRAEYSREKIYNYYDFNEIVKCYEKLIEEVFAESLKG
jgi:glycosyltransferase involved in cell wall biosynthesis